MAHDVVGGRLRVSRVAEQPIQDDDILPMM
jgi:hypothetical protein